ncbi:MAG: hypothetical protein IPN60_19685 [Saprospiraceae bacterium]|nr:hypothetical protein [Candidatus Opimibacter skivensis]
MKSILQFHLAFFLLSVHSAAGQPQLKWHSTYQGELASDRGNNIAVDDKGCSYVTGFTDAISGNSDCIVIKYDANGDALWVRRSNGASNGLDKGIGIFPKNCSRFLIQWP